MSVNIDSQKQAGESDVKSMAWDKHDRKTKRIKIRDKQRKPLQPCMICGVETFCDAYIRDNKTMCQRCAEQWDMRFDAVNYEERWVDGQEETPPKAPYREKKA